MSGSENTLGEITAAQMSAYETTYATKRRAIYRWVAIGREKGDPPPLAVPSAMIAWWQRVMAQRPPAKLLALAEKNSVSAPPPPTAARASAASAPPPPPAPRTQRPVDLSSIEEEGFAAQVRRVRIQLTANQQALEAAMADPAVSDATLQLRQRNVHLTVDLLRKCEATLEEQRKSRGDLIDITDVQADWGTLLATLAAMREQMAADVVAEIQTSRDTEGALLTFTPAQLAAVSAAILKVRAREDAHLRGAQHWKDSDAPEQRSAA